VKTEHPVSCAYIAAVNMAWVVQWLWLALFKWPNGVCVSPQLTMETDAVFEKLFSSYLIMDDGQSPEPQ
jgi:hypothetical protein